MRKTNNKGFSLIEIILYVGIVSVFIGGVVTFVLGIVNSRQKSSVEQRVIYALRLASRRINFEIRNAASINSVTTNSISLANSNSSLNPTVIDLNGGRIRIGYGGTGACPASSPCYLTSSDVTVQSLQFSNMSDAGDLSDSVRYEMAIKTGGGTGSLNWFYKNYATGSAEVRSK